MQRTLPTIQYLEHVDVVRIPALTYPHYRSLWFGSSFLTPQRNSSISVRYE